MSIVECPRCGYDFRAIMPDTACITPSTTPKSVVETEEVSLLEDEVRRLDNEIFSLHEARASLLRRINNARSATRHVPPEVLSTIFQFVSPPVDFMRSLSSDNPKDGMKPYSKDELFQCKMTAVSHSWRQAALSDPQLWSSLSLRLWLHPSVINANLSLFDWFSRNAGSLPMSIALDFNEQATSSSPEDRVKSLQLMEPIKKAVFVDHGDRIQCLCLIGLPDEWFPHLKNLGRCASLAVARPSQAINHDLPLEARLDLTELPRLRHVVLIEVLCPFSLPSTITTLHFRGVPADDCLEVLVTCPRLVKFEKDESRKERIEPVTNVNEPITIKELEYLKWSVGICTWDPRICRGFSFLRFSRLRTLHWSDDSDIYHIYADETHKENRLLMTKFFCHLPTTLSSLTFNRCAYSIEVSRELLGWIPHLSKLHFINCDRACVQPIVKAIGRPISQLEQEAIDTSISSDQTLLPNLSNLSITATRLSDLPDGYIFVDMLEAIHNSGKGQGGFKLSLNHPVSWNANDLDRMRMLESSGFSLELDLAN